MSAPTARSVLVAGASQGIGAATVEALVAHGHRVAGLSRSGRSPDGSLALTGDVRDDEQVQAAVAAATEANGPVEVLVANAGAAQDGLLVRTSPQQLTDTLDLNLVSAHRLTKAVLPGMLRRRSGCLLYVSSVVALAGAAGQTAYAASKAGLIGFARSVAVEYGSRGIRSNVVSPGFVRTAMTAALGEGAEEAHAEQIALRRVADPPEVASVLAFLAGDDAAYISGAIIPVDGGLHLGH